MKKLFILLLFSFAAKCQSLQQQQQVNNTNVPYIFVAGKHSTSTGRLTTTSISPVTVTIKNSSYQSPLLNTDTYSVQCFITDTINSNLPYLNKTGWDSLTTVNKAGLLRSGSNDSVRFELFTLNKSATYKVGLLINMSSSTYQNSFINQYYREFIVKVTANPLPVELVSFNAVRNGKYVNITWLTASEINSKLFNIQKSFDGYSFNTVTSIPSKGASMYNFQDSNNETNGVYYRLEQVDVDGRKQYSSTVFVKGLELNQVFVQGRNDMGYLISIASNEIPDTYFLLDLTGKLIYKQKATGILEENVSQGFYILKLTTKNGSIYSSKIIVR